MNSYRVMLYPKAYKDIDDIYAYIANEKLSPESAEKQKERIKKAILGLSKFPQSHQERQIGKYAGKGYRQILIDNYLAVFKIDEEKGIVYVVTVQYQGRNM